MEGTRYEVRGTESLYIARLAPAPGYSCFIGWLLVSDPRKKTGKVPGTVMHPDPFILDRNSVRYVEAYTVEKMALRNDGVLNRKWCYVPPWLLDCLLLGLTPYAGTWIVTRQSH